jgi:O-antigen/teichoic acid export membrane protein
VKQSSLILHAALSTAGVLVQGLSRFAVTALIGNVMGPASLAHVSAWLSLALILSLLWPTGAGNAASSFLSAALARGENPSTALAVIQRSFWWSCVVMVAIGVPVAVLALGADWADAISVAALIVTYSGYIFLRGVQVGLGRILATSLWDVISAVVTTALLLAVLGLQASSLLLWPITIGYAVFCARMLATAHRGHHELETVPLAEKAEIWHVIRWNSVGVLASNGLIQFSMLVAAGLYAAAMSLATPASMLSQAITQVLLARFAAWQQADPREARRNFFRVLAALSGLLAVVFAVVAVASGLILDIIYGQEYSGAVPIMQLLLAAVFAFSITLVIGAYLITTGQTSQSTKAALLGLGVGLATMVLGALLGWPVPIAGAAGVLAGYVVSLAATLLVAATTQRRGSRPSRSAADAPVV